MKAKCCAACARGKPCEATTEREQTPAQVKHCVAKVAKQHGGNTSRAFAICVAAGQKHGTLKPGTIQSTAKGKKADAAKKKEPGNSGAMKSYEKLLAKSRKKRSEDVMSVRTDMLKLLGEMDKDHFLTRRDAGPTSTGVQNKSAPKTPADNYEPPNVRGSGNKGQAAATATPKNGPSKKTPAADVAPPNVTGSGATGSAGTGSAKNGPTPKPPKGGVQPPNVRDAAESFKREARIYAGIDSKYELKPGDVSPRKPEEKGYLSTVQTEENEDPILKFALEGLREGKRSHPFE